MPTMDYTLLRGRIRDCEMTQKELAEKAGISEGQFCQKLALAQQTLAQPDLSGFHEMEEGLHRLEESFGEKPAAEKNEQ